MRRVMSKAVTILFSLSCMAATPMLAQIGGLLDTTPPTVSITSPQSGVTRRGVMTVTATASDNVAVAGVQFFVEAFDVY